MIAKQRACQWRTLIPPFFSHLIMFIEWDIVSDDSVVSHAEPTYQAPSCTPTQRVTSIASYIPN